MEDKKSFIGKDYNQLLEKWVDSILKRAEETEAKAESIIDYNYKKGKLEGYAQGLRMAFAMFHRLESKLKSKTGI